jgi:hypothetical protein
MQKYVSWCKKRSYSIFTGEPHATLSFRRRTTIRTRTTVIQHTCAPIVDFDFIEFSKK